LTVEGRKSRFLESGRRSWIGLHWPLEVLVTGWGEVWSGGIKFLKLDLKLLALLLPAGALKYTDHYSLKLG
jgi:hypothetical protein